MKHVFLARNLLRHLDETSTCVLLFVTAHVAACALLAVAALTTEPHANLSPRMRGLISEVAALSPRFNENSGHVQGTDTRVVGAP